MQTEKTMKTTPKQIRADLRKEAQAINERNRVPGDPHYKEPGIKRRESIHTHVFHDRIRAYHKEHGVVGFEHRQGIDVIQVVSWANGQTEIVEFEVEAIPALIEVLQRAYATKTRPNEFSCYAFEKKPEEDRIEKYL